MRPLASSNSAQPSCRDFWRSHDAACLSYAAEIRVDRNPMTKLSMHEDLPFDETATPPRVSTGDLPMHAEIRQIVTDAYERFRGNDSGTVADYIPCRRGIAGTVRDRRGRTLGSVVRDRRCRRAVLDAERLQAIRVRPRLQHAWTRTCSAAPRRKQHRLPVQLADGRRAERRTDDWSAGQRRRDRYHQSVPGATPEEKWASIRNDSRCSPDATRQQRGGRRLRVGHEHAQPGHRPPPQEYERLDCDPRRRPISTRVSAHWT